MTNKHFIAKKGLVVNSNSGNVTMEIHANDAMQIPYGNTGQRPTAVEGYFRYNTETNAFEGYANSAWVDFSDFVSVSPQSFTNSEMNQARVNIRAAPIDALFSKNIIINNDMAWSQEHGSASSNATFYPADQMYYQVGGFNASASRVTNVKPTEAYQGSLQISLNATNGSPAAGSWMSLEQKIEGININHLKPGTANATPITIGFWARCSDDLTFCSAFFDTDYITNYVKEHTITGNTWTWINYTIPANTTSGTWPNNNTRGGSFLIGLAAGSTYTSPAGNQWGNTYFNVATPNTDNFAAKGAGNTFHTTGWVVLPGDYIIPEDLSDRFIRDHASEYLRCARYYYHNPTTKYGGRYSTSAGMVFTDFPTQMRTAPSVTFTSQASITTGGPYTGLNHTGILMNIQQPWYSGLKADARM